MGQENPIILRDLDLSLQHSTGGRERVDSLPYEVQPGCIENCQGGLLPEGCPVTPQILRNYLAKFGTQILSSDEEILAQICGGMKCTIIDLKKIEEKFKPTKL